jgi:hypothetical protein
MDSVQSCDSYTLIWYTTNTSFCGISVQPD